MFGFGRVDNSQKTTQINNFLENRKQLPVIMINRIV